MRSLDDASLKRVADATRWNMDNCTMKYGHEAVCLVCHATGDDYGMGGKRMGCMTVGRGPVVYMRDTHPATFAEARYIRFAQRHGDHKAGRVMNQLARGILARRQIAGMPQESRTLETVS
jgi:hypothetical protein